MADLTQLTLTEIKTGLTQRDFSSEELTKSYVAKIERDNPALNAYLEVFGEVVAAARATDVARSVGDDRPLLGVPLAVKDNILIKGKRASSASRVLADYVASYDATVITRLKSAGAIFLGRTNMDEFAMGASTENSAYGVTKNPHDQTRVAGGSSGGSAAAVAAQLAPAALGSDTAGSIRQPAAFCGVIGLKTTYGRVSRYGLMALTSSLDQIGPITQTVADAELLFNIMAGQDEHDSTSRAVPTNLPPLPERSRLGVPEEFLAGQLKPEVEVAFRSALQDLQAAGHTIQPISLPTIKYSVPCYYIITPAEASTNLARYDGVRYATRVEGGSLWGDYEATRAAGFGPEPRRRIIIGSYVLSAGYYDAYYRRAVKVRELICREMLAAFETVDAIVTPTTPNVAFPIGEHGSDPVAMYLEDILTVPANMAGVPAISVPAHGRAGKLPIGIQFTVGPFREDLLFKLAAQYYGR